MSWFILLLVTAKDRVVRAIHASCPTLSLDAQRTGKFYPKILCWSNPSSGTAIGMVITTRESIRPHLPFLALVATCLIAANDLFCCLASSFSAFVFYATCSGILSAIYFLCRTLCLQASDNTVACSYSSMTYLYKK